jgi:hypothetical protein
MFYSTTYVITLLYIVMFDNFYSSSSLLGACIYGLSLYFIYIMAGYVNCNLICCG